MTANAFRIFMQSYIWYIPALLLGISWMFRDKYRMSNIEYRKDYEVAQSSGSEIRNSKFEIQNSHLWLIATFVVLGISLSRSIWIGCFAGLIALGWFYRKELLSSWKLVGRIVLNGIIALVIIFAAISFPLPPVDYASLGELFASRASTMDAAAVSRWNLLPVVVDKIKESPIMGHGFGASVTYETKDPRILATNPEGMYTTYAFEWGWLEHWVKFGILGFGVMIYLIVTLLRRIMALQGPKWLLYGTFAALIGIAVTHVFSTYFNHPLGLGALFLIEGFLTVNEA
jgi:O-antigen ligase